jgi:hypothetical protein
VVIFLIYFIWLLLNVNVFIYMNYSWKVPSRH